MTEHNIEEYGWRGAYIWNAGLSLQIVVFGALVFPLKPVAPSYNEQRDVEENLPKSRSLKGLKTSKSRMLLEKTLNHRYYTVENHTKPNSMSDNVACNGCFYITFFYYMVILTLAIYCVIQIHFNMIKLYKNSFSHCLPSILIICQLRTSHSRSSYSLSSLPPHRSFSSLRLSAEASYLSHSQLSLRDSHHHLNLRSNQHSFCSKGSHLVIGGIR